MFNRAVNNQEPTHNTVIWLNIFHTRLRFKIIKLVMRLSCSIIDMLKMLTRMYNNTYEIKSKSVIYYTNIYNNKAFNEVLKYTVLTRIGTTKCDGTLSLRTHLPQSCLCFIPWGPGRSGKGHHVQNGTTTEWEQ